MPSRSFSNGDCVLVWPPLVGAGGTGCSGRYRALGPKRHLGPPAAQTRQRLPKTPWQEVPLVLCSCVCTARSFQKENTALCPAHCENDIWLKSFLALVTWCSAHSVQGMFSHCCCPKEWFLTRCVLHKFTFTWTELPCFLLFSPPKHISSDLKLITFWHANNQITWWYHRECWISHFDQVEGKGQLMGKSLQGCIFWGQCRCCCWLSGQWFVPCLLLGLHKGSGPWFQ